MMRGPGADVLLARALVASAAAAGAPLAIAGSQTVPWHSATFTGARHAIDAEAPAGATIDTWLASLGPRTVTLAGHLLADVTVTCVGNDDARLRLRFDALTVAEH